MIKKRHLIMYTAMFLLLISTNTFSINTWNISFNHPYFFNFTYYQPSEWGPPIYTFPVKDIEFTVITFACTGQRWNNGFICAYMAPTDSFRVMGVDVTWPTARSNGKRRTSEYNPVILKNDAAITPETPFGLVSYGINDEGRSVNLLAVTGKNIITVYTVEYSTDEFAEQDTFSIEYASEYSLKSMQTGQNIRGFSFYTRGGSLKDTSYIHLYGTEGLYRRLTISSNRVLNEVKLDIPDYETIIHAGDYFVACSSGTIYSAHNGQLYGKPCNLPIIYVSANGTATTNAGNIWLKDTATIYQLLPEQPERFYIAAYKIYNTVKGAYMTMIDSLYQDYTLFLHDYPTSINTLKPDSLKKYLNTGCFTYKNGTVDSIEIYTHDYEMNNTVPAISICNNGVVNEIDLSHIHQCYYEASLEGEVRLESRNHNLFLREDSAFFNTEVSVSYENPMTSEIFWLEDEDSTWSIPWKYGDTLFFTLNDCSFKIRNDDQTSVVDNHYALKKKPVRIIQTRGNLVIRNNSCFNRVGIYGLNGKLLESQIIKGLKTATIPADFANRVYIITLTGHTNHKVIKWNCVK